MDIELSPETEKLIRQELERGEYDSASALVNEAIQQLLPLRRSDSGPTTSVLPESLIGVFDSTEESYGEKPRDPFAELVADELHDQGITVPWRR